VTYAYTSRGELGSVTDWLVNVSSYSDDAAGRRTGLALPGHLPAGPYLRQRRQPHTDHGHAIGRYADDHLHL
jgi:hypothetical protein